MYALNLLIFQENIEMNVDSESPVNQKQLGNEYFKQESYRHALSCYNIAIELDSCNPIYHTNAAACYIKLQEYEEGLTAATEALKLDSLSIKVCNDL